MKTYRSKETGLFVGRQTDQVDGETYETVEVPTNPKEDLLAFLNELVNEREVRESPTALPAPQQLQRPQPSESDVAYASFRDAVSEGRVVIDEWMLRAPLDVCLRLMGIVTERTREHLYKLEKERAK